MGHGNLGKTEEICLRQLICGCSYRMKSRAHNLNNAAQFVGLGVLVRLQQAHNNVDGSDDRQLASHWHILNSQELRQRPDNEDRQL